MKLDENNKIITYSSVLQSRYIHRLPCCGICQCRYREKILTYARGAGPSDMMKLRSVAKAVEEKTRRIAREWKKTIYITCVCAGACTP